MGCAERGAAHLSKLIKSHNPSRCFARGIPCVILWFMTFQYPPPESETAPAAPSPAPHYSVRMPQGVPLVTYTLLAITVAVYLLQIGSKAIYGFDVVAALGAKNNAAIAAGQWWRLFTPMFLHGGIFHIGFNMYALYIIGPSLERFYGKLSYLMLYLVAGVAGNVFSYIFSPYDSLGASTAIFGLLAAEGVFLYKNRQLFGNRAKKSLLNVLTVALVNFMIGLSPGIDNWGHLGGFIGGALYAWFAGPRMKVMGRPPRLELKNTTPQLLSLMLGVLALMLFLALAMVRG